MQQTIFLEDHGQDFLEWDIKDGVVVACRPCQGWVWNGTRVHNEDIRPGDILTITPHAATRARSVELMTLKYPVARVVDRPKKGT